MHWVLKGKSFEEIYNDLRNKLSSLDLLKTGFSMLNYDAVWSNDYD
ncbi:hypothetical protein SGQ44_12040 [Flavobacterium sp. Fl-77]|uniref:Uncharacterized protein n=1 Tax=Flavobacterium flavipigmentatum TaxID=2893884 RepID=A0AAJ2SHC2_9FLAO|nr:hypothetical protein [Flavobacterium sp. Fl-33]MDX6183043.1 hypothetical protein [Flavobacterium sp. Fl-33]MDX6186496.1 hypothetical protein [Flavobacterium sp. Fl-77]